MKRAGEDPSRTTRRSIRLFRSFLHEQTRPADFYGALARDTVSLVARHAPLDGRLVVDIGAGPAQFAEAFAAVGARYVGVDVDAHAVADMAALALGVVASADALPFLDASVDVAVSSNVLEHVRDPFAVADEVVRIVRPGGIAVVSYTNWLSPWGGHETSPWHYLGAERAISRYVRRHGHQPKNRYGATLFPVSVGAGLAWARRHPGAEVVEAVPRYHPGWACPVVAVPGVREVLTWNLLMVLRPTG